MKGFPTTQHPNGPKFTYVPSDFIGRVGGKLIAVKRKGAEPGVVIQYRNGRKVYKKNSDYPHITPIQYAK